MKLKELIKEFEEIGIHGLNMFGTVVKGIPTETAIDLIKQLDEPEKVKVPQFVADFIAKQKKLGRTLSYSIDASMSGIVAEWYWDNSELFALAWIFGYEVEKEKKYKITLLNRNDGDLYLVNQNADLANKYGHFSPTVLLFTKGTNFSKKCYKLTKKEVVLNDFGWVFDCPGIKIEEVE